MRSTLRLLQSVLAGLGAVVGALVLVLSSDPTAHVFALIAVVGGLSSLGLSSVTRPGKGG